MFNASLLYQYDCPPYFSRKVFKASRLLIIQSKILWETMFLRCLGPTEQSGTPIFQYVSPSWIGAIERSCLTSVITSNQVQAEQHVGAQNQVQRPCLYLIQFLQLWSTILSPYHFNRTLINVKWSETRTGNHRKDHFCFLDRFGTPKQIKFKISARNHIFRHVSGSMWSAVVMFGFVLISTTISDLAIGILQILGTWSHKLKDG